VGPTSDSRNHRDGAACSHRRAAEATHGSVRRALFTLVPASARPWRDALTVRSRYQFTLWCQQPGALHSWGEPYEFHRPAGWLVTIAPYVVKISRPLQILFSIGAGVAKLAVPELDIKHIQAELDLMNTLVRQLPDTALHIHSDPQGRAEPLATTGPKCEQSASYLTRSTHPAPTEG
jgi:hypothetical protein